METIKRTLSEITVEEFKIIIRDVVHECIVDELESISETIDILQNEALLKQINQADNDWINDKETSYVSWDKIKDV
ncbi:hypothetical protein MCHI_000549 [Candidatus Magnetoovum chiemensis]|nr:hypothetical protein MCHI_000549 [Candidatus Magnetoovum chiemensis]